MAIVLRYEFPGVTAEQYEGTFEKVGDLRPVPGLLVHESGPMPGGWHVIDIWESRETSTASTRSDFAAP